MSYLDKMFERNDQERREYWQKVKSEGKQLPCLAAKYEFPDDWESSPCKAYIRCNLTDKGCVCSYFAQDKQGAVMNGNYTNCPGFMEVFTVSPATP